MPREYALHCCICGRFMGVVVTEHKPAFPFCDVCDAQAKRKIAAREAEARWARDHYAGEVIRHFECVA